MKKIIFSSVCAVALFSVNSYAASINWETALNEAKSATTTAKDEFTGLTGVNDKFTAYTEAKRVYEDAVTALGAPKSGTTPASGAYETLDTKTIALIGDAKTATAQKTNATSLNDVLKYYKDGDGKAGDTDGKKAAAVEQLIADAKAGKTIDLSQNEILKGESITFSGTVKTDYDVAVTGLKNAKDAVPAKKIALDAKEKELKETVLGVEGGLEKAMAYQNAVNAELAVKETKEKHDAKVAEETKITQAKEAISQAQDKLKAESGAGSYADRTEKATTLVGSSDKVELKAKAQVSTLNELLKYYQEDSTDKDPAKAKAVQNLIAKVNAGEEIKAEDLKVGETENIMDGFSGITTKAAYDTAVNDVKTQEDAVSSNTSKLNEATAELAKIQAELNKAIVATPQGQEKAKSVAKSLGSLTNASGAAGEKLIALLASEAKEFKDLDPKTDKETIAAIKQAANEVAQEIINSKKESISQQALGTLNVQINNMNKRLGEVRGMNGEIGTWFRAYGGRYSTDTNHFNYYSTQVGADKLNSLGNGDLIVGGLFGFDKVNADAKSKSISLGAYASYIDNSGYFVDTVLKYARASHKQDGWDYKKQNIFLASIEGGYRFNVSDNGYIEPSLELITGHVGKYKATTGNTEISVDSFMPLIFKPQVFFGANINDFTFRAGFGGVINAKRNNANIRINNIVSGLDASSSTKLDRNNHGFASIGGSYKFSDNLRFNLGVERSLGGSLTQDYELNATIRYTF